VPTTSLKIHHCLSLVIAISLGFLPDSQANERSRSFERDFKAAASLRAKAIKDEGAKVVRLTAKRKAVYFSGLNSNQRTATEAFSKSLPVRFKTFDLESRQFPRSGNSYVTAYLVR
jgi:hypothetical protein